MVSLNGHETGNGGYTQGDPTAMPIPPLLGGGGKEMGWPRIRRRPDKRWVEGKTFRLTDEVRYIQRRAAENNSRIVTIGQLLLFSAESGDAWLLDVSDQLAIPIARGGDALSIHIEESYSNFSVSWMGSYQINGAAFIYCEKDSGRVSTILGYPTRKILNQISNIFG